MLKFIVRLILSSKKNLVVDTHKTSINLIPWLFFDLCSRYEMETIGLHFAKEHFYFLRTFSITQPMYVKSPLGR